MVSYIVPIISYYIISYHIYIYIYIYIYFESVRIIKRASSRRPRVRVRRASGHKHVVSAAT